MRKPGRVTKAYTNDQRLLMEIRDALEALTLALSLSRQDVDAAANINDAIAALEARCEHLDAVTTLLQRFHGIGAEKLSDDELALLTDAGALA